MKEIVRPFTPAVTKAAEWFFLKELNRRGFLYVCGMAGFGFSSMPLLGGCKKTRPHASPPAALFDPDIRQTPEGGKVAVIEGQAGVYAAKQRTLGFNEALAGTNLSVVASASGDWDMQKSLDVASGIIRQHPDIKGFYCNNDIMALGVVEAVNNAGRRGKISVIGTDGIRPAYDSIRAGKMTGTVDSFPFATGQVAIEVAVRLLGGQSVPRVVFSPQNLVTNNNIDNPLPK